MLLGTVRQQLKRLEQMDKDIADIEKRLTLWKKDQQAVTRLMAIPGVGLLTATAIIATVGDMKSFRSWREFAAFLGLVPRQSGTGGKVRLLGISKRGDSHLRKLLTHGARAVVNFQINNRNHWMDKLLCRRPTMWSSWHRPTRWPERFGCYWCEILSTTRLTRR